MVWEGGFGGMTGGAVQFLDQDQTSKFGCELTGDQCGKRHPGPRRGQRSTRQEAHQHQPWYQTVRKDERTANRGPAAEREENSGLWVGNSRARARVSPSGRFGLKQHPQSEAQPSRKETAEREGFWSVKPSSSAIGSDLPQSRIQPLPSPVVERHPFPHGRF